MTCQNCWSAYLYVAVSFKSGHSWWPFVENGSMCSLWVFSVFLSVHCTWCCNSGYLLILLAILAASFLSFMVRVPYLYIFMFDIYHLMIIVTGFACVCPEFSLAEVSWICLFSLSCIGRGIWELFLLFPNYSICECQYAGCRSYLLVVVAKNS